MSYTSARCPPTDGARPGPYRSRMALNRRALRLAAAEDMVRVSDDEVFLPFRSPRERMLHATAIRSTWVGSSLQAIRERSLFDQYIEHVAPEYRAPILESVAGVWLPMEVGLAHYQACDQLGLGKRERWEIGVHVTRKVHGTSLGLAIRLAKQTGVTPWTILAQIGRLWDRVYQGGDVAVYRRGPKEAVVEIAGWPLAPIPYVQQTMPAVVHAIVAMFCATVYTHDVPTLASTSSLGLRLQWV
jgi:hypothetical protein